MFYRYTFIEFIFFILLLQSCQDAKTDRKLQVASYEIFKEELQEIIPGAERIALYYPKLENRNVALVVNHTSLVKEKHLVDTLLNLGVAVRKVFAPEHGFRGDKSDGEQVADNLDSKTGLPIVSLYGIKKKPTAKDLQDIDVVVFDIQDVGARFYTYISTMHYVMEACAENGVKIIILDRPNPHTDYIDGPTLEAGMETFVGLHPVPVIYGMTIGEYAKMIKGEKWFSQASELEMDIVEITNYKRSDYYALPVKPSPNLPNMLSILMYPSLCFFEGTEVSVGRGTDLQFQVLGHPTLKEYKFSFLPMPNSGSKYPPQEGKTCFGIDLSKETLGSWFDKNQLDLTYLIDFYTNLTDNGENFFLPSSHFDRLAGTKKLKAQIKEGLSEEEIRKTWQQDLKNFQLIRKKYLIYRE